MPDLSPFAKGAMGEQGAVNALTARGMHVLETNYRVVGGELDIILQDGNTLVFVEVKTRLNSDRLQAEAAVTPTKRKRLQKAALHFLGEHPEWEDHPIRFDVVLMLPGETVHIQNAFEGTEW